MTDARRTLAALLAAAAFGLLAGAFKGNETGLRGEIGNLSAPWLLVAALPASSCRTLVRGAVTGLVSTMVALAGFYAALTVVLAGHLGGGGFLRELAVEAEANRIYFLAGAVTGPVLGAVGAWVGRRHPSAVWLLVGLLLAGEIVGVALLQGRQLAPPPLYFVWGVTDWTPYVGEALVGLAIIVAALGRRRRRVPAER
jgi:MYXO-CTERM domain-containing protein